MTSSPTILRAERQPQRQRHIFTFAVFLLVIVFVFASLAVRAPGALAGDADRSLAVRSLGRCTDTAGLGVVTAALGTDQITGGTFNISGIPAGAAVVEAWLYWNGADDGNNVEDNPASFNPATNDGDPTITLNGAQVPQPQRIGGPANWIGVMPIYSYAYRANVTAVVTGNGNYVVGGMDNFFGEQGFNNGMELVVVYRLAGAPLTYVGIGEGLDLAYGSNGPNVGPGTTAAFFPLAPDFSKRQAQITVFLGGAGADSQTSLWYETGDAMPPFPDALHLVGRPTAVKISNPFHGKHNQNNVISWDSYDFTVNVPANAIWLAVQVESENADPPAMLDWLGAVVRLPLTCASRTYTPLLLRTSR